MIITALISCARESSLGVHWWVEFEVDSQIVYYPSVHAKNGKDGKPIIITKITVVYPDHIVPFI